MPIDKEQLIIRILGASEKKLEQIAAILSIQEETGEQVGDIITSQEWIDTPPELVRFAEMYNKWSPLSKSRLTWKQVKNTMLANNSALLNQVDEISKKLGKPIVMFGAKDGNILFANGGKGPILTGKRYAQSRQAAKDIELELFPYDPPSAKSEEILMFEEFTGMPIVSSEDGKPSIWLENGTVQAAGSLVAVAIFDADTQSAEVYYEGINCNFTDCGVRGLLKAKA